MKGNINHEYLYEVRRLIGDWLRQCREDKNLSQEELGEIIGVDKSTISKIEKGKWSFSIDMLTRFSLALDVYLFFLPKNSKDPLAEDMRNRWKQSRTDN